MSSLPESILVVRLGAIGDVTNALVFAEAIRAHDPKVRIGWAIHPLARPLVEGHPAVDRVHVWPRERPLRGFLELRAELRREEYALAVDLQRIAKSAVLARSSGAPRVLGYDRGRAKELSWLFSTERIAPGDPRAHMVEHYLAFARHLGIPDPLVRHRLPTCLAAEEWARGLISDWGAAPVLLSIGASKPRNRWPAERFGRLAHALNSGHDGPVVLVGGPGDRSLEQEALASAKGCVTSLVGQTDLPQLIALLGEARLLVSADSGPMHLAAAQDCPVVALFGPADALRTGPWGSGHRIVRVPEWNPSVPLGPARMEDVSVDLVANAVLEQVSTPGLLENP